jgi:peptidoglycan LD-endopeptidase CwlK
MAVTLDDLDAGLRDRVTALLDRCQAEGVEMRPFITLRTPLEQAKLWRQSRAREEIIQKITELRAAGAAYLAGCIEAAGPQNGPHVTDAPPGFSWHQWGEAADCFWVVDGKAEWSTKRLVGGRNGYRRYASVAADLALTPGGLWPRFKDWPHVQLRPENSPGGVMTLTDMDARLAERFPL